MKKILFVIVSFFLLLEVANASSISSIDMDISLNEEGTATVTETWDAYVNQGTEGWHPYYNIGESKIRVLSASMDGEEYAITDYWNENSSLNDKAYKAGIYMPSSDELDIVFGITSYGYHTYKVVYQITNFISNLTDSDMAYWTLFPDNFSSSPGNVTIKIHGYYDYPDDLEVWGYGMYGAPCYVKDGAIYMTSDGRISSSEYLTLLAKFPQGTFNTTSKLENDFSYYLDMANEGATKYKREKTGELLGIIVAVLFFISIFLTSIISIYRSVQKNKKDYDFGVAGKDLPKDINNYRDIPCNKNIYRAFWVADTYNLVKDKNDFIGAILLKWIYDNNVTVKTETVKKLFGTKKQDVIIFNNEPASNEHEINLYNYMLDASGDGILEQDEFKKWCRDHYTKIFRLVDDILDYERDELIKEGKITDEIRQKGLIFKYDVHKYVINPSLKEEAIEMKGLKNFLREFSQIDKKEPIEFKLWKDYLIYAQIFGMAREVMDRFKNFYPDVMREMEYNNFNYSTFYFVNSLSRAGVGAATAARRAAESYSSGGGGFSSGGGGGGSFGGGGGGGGFR